MQAGDTLFVDTNILLAATDEGRAQHQAAQTLFAASMEAGVRLALSGQNLREYLVVATRSATANGLGLGVSDAVANVEQFARYTVLYEETRDVVLRLRELVRECELIGTRIHDANIAATMSRHGLSQLVTQNPDDFKGLPEVTTMSLEEALRSLPVTGS